MFQFDRFSPSADADPFHGTVRRGQVTEYGLLVAHLRRDVLVGFDSAKQPPIHMLAPTRRDADISPTPVQGCRYQFDFAGLLSTSARSVTGRAYLGDNERRALLHCEFEGDERILSYLETTDVS